MSPSFLPVVAALLAVGLCPASAAEKHYTGKPLRLLLITGGCCHNYAFQSQAMKEGVSARVDSEWKVVNEGGTGTRGQIALYDQADWGQTPLTSWCTTSALPTRRTRSTSRRSWPRIGAGTPAVVVHCAMHTYRAAAVDAWREFLESPRCTTSTRAVTPVTLLAPDHAALRGFPTSWTTPMDELYVIKKLWPGATALATSVSEKTGESQPVVWVNDYHGTRVFGTTYGHSDDTFRDPLFIDLLARGHRLVGGEAQISGTTAGFSRVAKPGARPPSTCT
jgi:hypothetical protein